MLAPLVGTQQLQEKPEHRRVRFARSLVQGSVLIPQVGVRTFITERQEKLIVLVDHTAHCTIPRRQKDFIMGLLNRCQCS